MAKDQYVKAADFNLKAARHNHTVFVRDLRTEAEQAAMDEARRVLSLAGVNVEAIEP